MMLRWIFVSCQKKKLLLIITCLLGILVGKVVYLLQTDLENEYVHKIIYYNENHMKQNSTNNDTKNLKQLQTKRDINKEEEINIMKKSKRGNYMDDIMITIWSNEPIVTIDENPIIVTSKDLETNLYDRHDNVQYQLCSEHATNISEMESMIENTNSIYSCPISLSKIIPIQQDHHFRKLHTNFTNSSNSTDNVINLTSIFTYDTYVHNQLENIVFFLNETIYHTPTRRDLQQKIHTISYWSWDLRRHISIDFPTGEHEGLLEWKKFRKCIDIDCPKRCNIISRNHTNEKQEVSKINRHKLDVVKIRMQWDGSDGLCKSNHPATRPPYRKYGGSCSCTQTCFTPLASDLFSSWPWSNQSQREYFYPTSSPSSKRPSDNNTTLPNIPMSANKESHNRQQRQRERIQERQRRIDRNERRKHTVVERFVCPVTTTNTTIEMNIKDTSSISSNLHGTIHSAAQHHLYFLPNAKLIFCGIPKVGITEWMKFFRYTYGAQDYLSSPYFKADQHEFFVSRLSIEKAEELLLKDPSWTKAVFIRNPAERLLSAYLDKVLKRSFTQSVFHIDISKDTNSTKLSFREFVELVTYNPNSNITNTSTNNVSLTRQKACDDDPRGLHWCSDPHWRPQIMTCGLDALLPHFDFIGTMDYISEQTKLLLEKVGLWETYGKEYNDGRSASGSSTSTMSSKCGKPPPLPPLTTTTTNNDVNDTKHTNISSFGGGFNQLGPSETYRHATNSTELLRKYYTPELLAKVKKAYALDYAIWNDVKNRPPNQVTKGSDLKIVQKYCSKVK